jgi:hypothetical protein
MYKFKIPNSHPYLGVDIQGYFHDLYHTGDNDRRKRKGTVENIITVLKNSFGNESRENLADAKNALKKILKSDLIEMPRLAKKNSLTVCVIPRAKKQSAYNIAQLFFKNAVAESIIGLNQLNDGTEFIIRHTNTRTTHLNRSGNGGDGELPYPGITLETCHISKSVMGKDIILIDDLYTKTVNIDEDAIQALLTKGAKSVTFYSLGKTYNTEFNNGQEDQKVVLVRDNMSMPNKCRETYYLIQEGKNLKDISTIKGVKEDTIVDHICEIAKINGNSFAVNFKPKTEIIDLVRSAVKKIGSNEKLQPIYAELGEQVSYNNIKLSLIFID